MQTLGVYRVMPADKTRTYKRVVQLATAEAAKAQREATAAALAATPLRPEPLQTPVADSPAVITGPVGGADLPISTCSSFNTIAASKPAADSSVTDPIDWAAVGVAAGRCSASDRLVKEPYVPQPGAVGEEKSATGVDEEASAVVTASAPKKKRPLVRHRVTSVEEPLSPAASIPLGGLSLSTSLDNLGDLTTSPVKLLLPLEDDA